MNVKKAVFPVAGLGTRFLPATKATPKEMMPVVDMPLIQYAVNEAVAAGITELIFVTNNNKHAIEAHFSSNFELEKNLIEFGKHELLDVVQHTLPEGVSCTYILQKSPRGLGHAVLCAKQFVGDEPFAVLLADDLIDGKEKSCLQQMMDVFQEYQSSLVAVQKVSYADTQNYGVIDVLPGEHNIAKIQGIIEKPTPANAPSDLAIVGRYILVPKIFELLEHTVEGSGGEIQLTDAIAKLLLEQSVYSLQFQGKRYDCGSKLGYLEATIAFALKHPELSHDFKNLLLDFVECKDSV
jgi:UTP--glucose-1-phosphate uridylyltransferase